MKFKSILMWLFVAVVIAFALQNSAMTEVNFLLWKVSISRILIILGSFGMGILVGMLILLKRKTNLNQ